MVAELHEGGFGVQEEGQGSAGVHTTTVVAGRERRPKGALKCGILPRRRGVAGRGGGVNLEGRWITIEAVRATWGKRLDC